MTDKALRVSNLAYFKTKQDAYNEGKFVAKEGFEAQANVLEGVKVNGAALAIAEKMVDILVATGTANGTVKVNGADVSVAGLAALAYKAEVSYSDLAAALAAKVDAVDTLVGSDAAKSVRAISAEEVAKVVASAPEDFDTLKEIADWIAADTTGSARMASDISALKDKLALGTREVGGEQVEYANVKAYVEAVVSGLTGYTNVIETVKVNGTALVPDAAKAVDVTVPTKTSELSNDSDFAADASYVHTDNNYTTAEKDKLAGVAAGAQPNVIETVKVNNAALTPDAKAVNITVPTTVAELADASDYLKAADLVWGTNADVDELFE